MTPSVSPHPDERVPPIGVFLLRGALTFTLGLYRIRTNNHSNDTVGFTAP
jgi:hypothetical protein